MTRGGKRGPSVLEHTLLKKTAARNCLHGGGATEQLGKGTGQTFCNAVSQSPPSKLSARRRLNFAADPPVNNGVGQSLPSKSVGRRGLNFGADPPVNKESNADTPVNNGAGQSTPSKVCVRRKLNFDAEAPVDSGKTEELDIPKCYRRLYQVAESAWELPERDNCTFCHAVLFPYEPPGFCCGSGQVKVDVPKMEPRLWDLFVNDVSPLGKEFRRRCRSYNNSLAFSSMAYEQDSRLLNNCVGAYTVKLQGIISHYVKNMVPTDGVPRHAQLYFYGTENELENRLSQANDLERPIMELLLDILKVNPYHNFFVKARELPSQGSFSIVLLGDPVLDPRVYNRPVVDHVAAIWHENSDDVEKRPRDVRVYFKKGGYAQVKYFYGCYDPLRYVLLHPYGEPRWRMGLKKLPKPGTASGESVDTRPRGRKRVRRPAVSSSPTRLLYSEEENLSRKSGLRDCLSLREYYAFIFQIRPEDEMSILKTGRILQQYMIDMYIKAETQRLDYLRKNQKRNRVERRGESLQEIRKAVKERKRVKGFAVGQRVKLNTSFIGGPRDLRRRYMNALALVSKYGTPDLFITMTCNRHWPEIRRHLLETEDVCNRADLLARVFRAKNEELKRELIDKELFGQVAAYFYVIEFQKRGLPHVHWLIIMKPEFKLSVGAAYDRFVSAEIPDPEENKHLYDCVVRHMMHGPCGDLKKTNVCMLDGKCKNSYPKEFRESTEHREDAYPGYRRRQNGRLVRCRGCTLDNRWVVPYNPFLLAKFDCHINVEICASIKSVKYLYKYVCKGSDQVAYNVVDEDANGDVDEIHNYRTARWVCAPEAMYRLYKFDLFGMHPPVQQLHVHLEDYQWMSYNDDDDLEDLVDDEESDVTQLTQFFKMNQKKNVRALKLLYSEFPQFFVWQKQTKRWTWRKKGTSIGRPVAVRIMDVERYYLRLLLNNVRSPTSFENLRTYKGVVYATFREAALHRGLLQSDADLLQAMDEASGYQMPYALRRFLCIILVNNAPSNPRALWENYKDDLSSDILLECGGDVERAYGLALENIDTILYSMGQSITKYHLVDMDIGATREEMFHREYLSELNTNPSEEDLNSVGMFNNEQKLFFDKIMHSVRTDSGKAFFVDGPGGTGKTFLYKALLATVRSTVGVALAVASSGVAASLLPNGRTAHSRFKLPLKPEETLSCTMGKTKGEAKLIIAAKLIIWDEASMANRRHIEALDLLLQDLMGNQLLFGGKTVVFGGDFRQTIPIVTRGSREACVDACFVNSHLWRHIEKLRLVENMRAKEDPEFVQFLIRVGEGTETYSRGDFIQLPDDMLMQCSNEDNEFEPLIRDIFPSFDDYKEQPSSAINRAILTPKNAAMEAVNAAMIAMFPGEMKEYVSNNYTKDASQQGFYQDYLDGINVGALPPHVLQLKPNCPVMLMRNLNPNEGLCNGTRLIVRDAGDRLIRATIASGELIGKDVLIPRISLELEDVKICPVPFKRMQFPIRLCFAMSINKAQGQTLDRVGVYLPAPVFSHGQLYVALSRVRRFSAVKVMIKSNGACQNSVGETRNVVFQEVLNAAA